MQNQSKDNLRMCLLASAQVNGWIQPDGFCPAIRSDPRIVFVDGDYRQRSTSKWRSGLAEPNPVEAATILWDKLRARVPPLRPYVLLGGQVGQGLLGQTIVGLSPWHTALLDRHHCWLRPALLPGLCPGGEVGDLEGWAGEEAPGAFGAGGD